MCIMSGWGRKKKPKSFNLDVPADLKQYTELLPTNHTIIMDLLDGTPTLKECSNVEAYTPPVSINENILNDGFNELFSGDSDSKSIEDSYWKFIVLLHDIKGKGGDNISVDPAMWIPFMHIAMNKDGMSGMTTADIGTQLRYMLGSPVKAGSSKDRLRLIVLGCLSVIILLSIIVILFWDFHTV